jgi:NAD(P)-dependent dehydrogenase (short-subunit alcohol dehydrogenase family)
MKARGKVIVVTGAGNGVGRAVALEALGRGARVAAVDVSPTGLAETATLAAAWDRLSTHVLDITDETAVAALPAEVSARFGAVDGLVHLAAIIQPFLRVKDLDRSTIERVFAVNWWGTVNLDRAFLPVLLERPEGHIVNTSSMGGFIPVPGQTIYGASKAAVKLFTEALHAECRGTPVRVTVVIPGGMATNMAANSGVTVDIDPARAAEMSKRLTTPQQAATAILDGMERNAYRVLIGRDARLMDLLYRVNPAGASAFIARQMRGLLSGSSG